MRAWRAFIDENGLENVKKMISRYSVDVYGWHEQSKHRNLILDGWQELSFEPDDYYYSTPAAARWGEEVDTVSYRGMVGRGGWIVVSTAQMAQLSPLMLRAYGYSIVPGFVIRAWCKVVSSYTIIHIGTTLYYLVGTRDDMANWNFVWRPYTIVVGVVCFIIDVIEAILGCYCIMISKAGVPVPMRKAVDSMVCLITKDAYTCLLTCGYTIGAVFYMTMSLQAIYGREERAAESSTTTV